MRIKSREYPGISFSRSCLLASFFALLAKGKFSLFNFLFWKLIYKRIRENNLLYDNKYFFLAQYNEKLTILIKILS